MSKQNEILEYKKKIADLTGQINAVRAKKDELILTLQHLNIGHKQGKIGKLEYSHKWSETLAGKTAEEYIANYDRQIYELAESKKSYLAKVRTSEATEKKLDRNITLAASLMIIFAVVAGLAISPLGEITGFAVSDETATISNATIMAYVSTAKSNNLSRYGVDFASLAPGTTNNAPKNNTGGASGGTELYLAVSSDSNVNVDFCIKSNDDLWNKTAFYMGIKNMTWSNATSTSAAVPEGPPGVANMTTTYADSIMNLVPGNNAYYRFWLDVPGDQDPGGYNNTISFKAIQTGAGC